MFVLEKSTVAHVFGHTDFFKHNLWFAGTNRGMVESVSQNAGRIREYNQEVGDLEVEKFLDSVLSISDHIDPYPRRERQTESDKERPTFPDPFRDLFPGVKKGESTSLATGRKLAGERKGPAPRRRIPEEPEKDVLRFLLEHAELEDWQRDVIAIVREESLYFVPQMQTNGSIGAILVGMLDRRPADLRFSKRGGHGMKPMAAMLVVNVVAVPYHGAVGLAAIMGLANARQTHEFLVAFLILFLFGSLPTLITAWVFRRRHEGVSRALAVTELLLALVYGGGTLYLLNA